MNLLPLGAMVITCAGSVNGQQHRGEASLFLSLVLKKYGWWLLSFTFSHLFFFFWAVNFSRVTCRICLESRHSWRCYGSEASIIPLACVFPFRSSSPFLLTLNLFQFFSFETSSTLLNRSPYHLYVLRTSLPDHPRGFRLVSSLFAFHLPSFCASFSKKREERFLPSSSSQTKQRKVTFYSCISQTVLPCTSRSYKSSMISFGLRTGCQGPKITPFLRTN